ncbi:hypothetical protein SUGI_0493040 [Cryptomeria japonica]|nr:hypothetical protein SUGI_0493040 [Cryptomeria japonica]
MQSAKKERMRWISVDQFYVIDDVKVRRIVSCANNTATRNVVAKVVVWRSLSKLMFFNILVVCAYWVRQVIFRGAHFVQG